MFKKMYVFLACLFCCNNIFGSCISTPIEKTFFRPKPVIEDVSLFLAMNDYRIYQKYLDIPVITNEEQTREENYYFHGALFFTNSRKSQEVKNYFFPNGIVTSSDNSINEIQNYVICPTRQLVGICLNYHQDFCFVENLWLDAKLAVYRAKHSFVLQCHNCCDVPAILQDLESQKISLCPSKKIGIDDIQVNVGYIAYQCSENNSFLNTYGTVILPTASKPKANCLFEPLVGIGHWGLGLGLNGGFKIFESLQDKRYIALLGDLSYQYLFSGCESRLIKSATVSNSCLAELNNLPNSEAISTLLQSVLNNNSVTFKKQKFDVTPRSVINLWTALHYQHFSWNIEFGYNLWWKDSEKIKAANCTNQELCSVAQLSALTNTIYMVTGYFATLANHTIPLFFGGSYEFARDRNALEQWQIWLGAEFSF